MANMANITDADEAKRQEIIESVSKGNEKARELASMITSDSLRDPLCGRKL